MFYQALVILTWPDDGGGVGTWSNACVGDPDVREDYDLGGTVVRSAAFVSTQSRASFQSAGLQVSTSSTT